MADLEYRRVPSLDLNWLSRRHRHLPLPAIAENRVDSHVTSAMYMPPRMVGILPDGDTFWSGPSGVIILQPGCQDTARVLAHEWAHHMQHHRGMDIFGVGGHHLSKVASRFDMDSYMGYRGFIRAYFRESVVEMGALLFERLADPCGENEEIMEIVFNHSNAW